jgi:opacity protein-like surface antigen
MSPTLLGDSEVPMVSSALSVLMVFIVSVSAIAQERPVQIYLSTGAALPTSDFNLKYNYGFNGSVGVGFKIDRALRAVPKMEIQTFSIDPSAFEDSINGGDYTALMMGIDFRMFNDVRNWVLDPVLLVGGGLAYSAVSALTVGSVFFDSRSETKFYVNVGAGVDIRLTSRHGGFITCRYVRISSGGTRAEFFPINIGMRF